MPTRLLLDENVSEQLGGHLASKFPDVRHVRDLGLGGAKDSAVWDLALRDRCVLVTKDEDFVTLSVLRGAPPKVVWLNVGNAGTSAIARLLLDSADAIEQFVAHPDAGFLALSFGPRSG
ncbi:MAG: DUF5615 family PIN-like protein [Gemmatimonadaceae bacterium]